MNIGGIATLAAFSATSLNAQLSRFANGWLAHPNPRRDERKGSFKTDQRSVVVEVGCELSYVRAVKLRPGSE
ncbi:exported hypothetical protein [Mesorhizobium metallidurans STM 2683]|uniref:Uncharacterized protein n=1 Tax=Mesorhizobium metallidurans STM 2683 TaxID=1297569 RepID=M5EX08_9HYPH|nr:exported hypothetical protein [Mesorhizobium metallidurans STM 2683]